MKKQTVKRTQLNLYVPIGVRETLTRLAAEEMLRVPSGPRVTCGGLGAEILEKAVADLVNGERKGSAAKKIKPDAPIPNALVSEEEVSPEEGNSDDE